MYLKNALFPLRKHFVEAPVWEHKNSFADIIQDVITFRGCTNNRWKGDLFTIFIYAVKCNLSLTALLWNEQGEIMPWNQGPEWVRRAPFDNTGREKKHLELSSYFGDHLLASIVTLDQNMHTASRAKDDGILYSACCRHVVLIIISLLLRVDEDSRQAVCALCVHSHV